MKIFKSLIVLSLFSSAFAFSNECVDNHGTYAKKVFLSIQRVEQQDINGDGEPEFIYYGDCSKNTCVSQIFENQAGCFTSIFKGSSEISFTNELPKNITDHFKSARKLDLTYKVISEYSSNCAGYIQSNGIYVFSTSENKYVNIHRSTTNLCKFK